MEDVLSLMMTQNELIADLKKENRKVFQNVINMEQMVREVDNATSAFAKKKSFRLQFISNQQWIKHYMRRLSKL